MMPSRDRETTHFRIGARSMNAPLPPPPPSSHPDIHTLKLTVLVDNHTFTDRYFIGEPGLSILVDAHGKRVLFDTGYSGAFLTNAMKMGEDLLHLDSLVFSHGHLDHTWGITHLVQHLTEATIEGREHTIPNLIAHPACFYPRSQHLLSGTGTLMSAERLGHHIPVRTTAEPRWITENLVFLGEIPRKFAFERTEPGQRRIVMPDGRIEPDGIVDDSALACRCPEGLVIITGCSHSGICNITEYAREICKERRILDIIGGFHLLNPPPEQMEGTCRYLREVAPRALHPCHCTSLGAKCMLAGSSPVKETGVGLRLEY
jgi:7,8-dihydropterin-6-yl-methyl-4-(beta-D-ribofuranosyl)aminobenzene 5'-phosphate synthase